MNEVLAKLRRELEERSDEKVRESAGRFFKEEVRPYGMSSAEVGRIGKEYFKKIKDGTKTEILALCEDLWRSGRLEESFIACHWSYSLREDYEPKDFKVFERWVNDYVDNWASCDTLCNHTVGSFLEMYPESTGKLKTWCGSKNRWTRRASAVSFIVPAKKGLFLEDIFEIADALLTDGDDLVQKGYGWMLKAASQSHEKAVFDYVVRNKASMPRTALRYAIEKMPKDLKSRAMA